MRLRVTRRPRLFESHDRDHKKWLHHSEKFPAQQARQGILLGPGSRSFLVPPLKPRNEQCKPALAAGEQADNNSISR